MGLACPISRSGSALVCFPYKLSLCVDEKADWLVMLNIPSQYIYYCLVLFCEVYCVIVYGLGIIVAFFVT